MEITWPLVVLALIVCISGILLVGMIGHIAVQLATLRRARKDD